MLGLKIFRLCFAFPPDKIDQETIALGIRQHLMPFATVMAIRQGTHVSEDPPRMSPLLTLRLFVVYTSLAL